jgi:hypothetical protein
MEARRACPAHSGPPPVQTELCAPPFRMARRHHAVCPRSHAPRSPHATGRRQIASSRSSRYGPCRKFIPSVAPPATSRRQIPSVASHALTRSSQYTRSPQAALTLVAVPLVPSQRSRLSRPFSSPRGCHACRSSRARGPALLVRRVTPSALSLRQRRRARLQYAPSALGGPPSSLVCVLSRGAQSLARIAIPY